MFPIFYHSLSLKSIAQLIKASYYACTGRYPVQARVVFLNELSISISLSTSISQEQPSIAILFISVVEDIQWIFSLTQKSTTSPQKTHSFSPAISSFPSIFIFLFFYLFRIWRMFHFLIGRPIMTQLPFNHSVSCSHQSLSLFLHPLSSPSISISLSFCLFPGFGGYP